MKHMKRFIALFAALALMLTMAVPALADSTSTNTKYTITAPTATGTVSHTYEVYQIFTGDLKTETDGTTTTTTLSNIKWGKNGKNDNAVVTEGTAVEETVLTALKAATGSDTRKLAVIKNYVDLTSANAYGTVVSGNFLSVPAGYYLIKDRDNSLGGKDDAYTTYIVQVLGDVVINAKSAKPSVDKQVKDEAGDAEAGATDGWGETADHAINETFKFRLIATISADTDFDAYQTYAVKFNDTMSKGVVFESIESVKINGVNVPTDEYTTTATAGMTAGTNENSKSWSLEISDIKSITGVTWNTNQDVKIIVTYNAYLNELAKVNISTTDTTTTNKNTVNLEYSNNPNASGTGTPEYGKTPDDSVWVFTYGVNNTKYDATDPENKKPLAGAQFRLYTDENCTNEVSLIYDDTLRAYRPVKSGETATAMTSAAKTGVFNIRGLDAGTYYLKETVTPSGFNTCDNIEVEISADHSEDTTGGHVTFTSSDTTKEPSLSYDVDNKRGTTLPSTGGIGTTLFYVVGGGLMVAAAVLLITKKRMENK